MVERNRNYDKTRELIVDLEELLNEKARQLQDSNARMCFYFANAKLNEIYSFIDHLPSEKSEK